jgi:lysophospholipase L1-like esterase
MRRRQLIGIALSSALGIALVIGIARYRYDADFRYAIAVLIFDLLPDSASRKIVLIGDSRVASLECAKELQHSRVLNLGFAGLTVEQALRVANAHFNQLHGLYATVIWVGVNDIRGGREAALVMKDTSALLDLVHTRSDHVLLLGQFPLEDDDPSAREVNSRLKIINEDMSVASRTHGYDVVMLPLTEGDLGAREFYLDALHLNAKGNRLACAAIERWLETD